MQKDNIIATCSFLVYKLLCSISKVAIETKKRTNILKFLQWLLNLGWSSAAQASLCGRNRKQKGQKINAVLRLLTWTRRLIYFYALHIITKKEHA